MSYTSLDIDPAVYGTQIVIARTSGRPLDGGILSSRCFGLASATDPYFDPAGALPGELAPLGFDAARGTFFLVSGQTPDLHLMGLRRAGPAPARIAQSEPAVLARALKRAATKRARARRAATTSVSSQAPRAQASREAARLSAAPAGVDPAAHREREHARRAVSAAAPDPEALREQLLARWRAAGDRRLKAGSPT